jgi:hypothetical protein
MSANSSKIYVREELARMQGILKTVELNMEDRAEIERLESEAEKGVLMGLCKGVNVGVREALRKRHLIGALSDGTMQWPRCSLIKMVCGSELVGEEVIDAAKREECKQKGDLVVGEIVFYKDKIEIMRSKHDEMRVQILPLEMQEVRIVCRRREPIAAHGYLHKEEDGARHKGSEAWHDTRWIRLGAAADFTKMLPYHDASSQRVQ